ncbi:Pectate lyase [Pseudomonas sp. IT-P44]|jgi:hypothetical protein|uniref:Uncharacterized protein n=1 Tax=Pseudomonas migulae TaxID=78543 RepID=A0ABY8MT35_9PSED|nr:MULTISPECIES: hypothetical protein [Pseudomonas]EJM82316.1 hypothetical protein PMI32_02854 [Pseudomonas sp. GM60]EJM84485.1 hypothetical protein PMI33_03982 [Pseudomonas sp. GM67]MBD9547212.1 hypothetical protein [Pseudomonas sp. PDM01]MBD9590703.1 hypothetical protein [Pseudomonas sp. PDM03]MBD9612770.1 hypothetical protein [Pseudomonas sp. PDM02]
MTGFKNLLLAFTVLSASTAAFASDDNVASLALGKTGERPKKSLTLHSIGTNGVVSHDSAWGAQLGRPNPQADYCAAYANVSVFHNGIKLRQENLMGRYDLS